MTDGGILIKDALGQSLNIDHNTISDFSEAGIQGNQFSLYNPDIVSEMNASDNTITGSDSSGRSTY